MLRALLVVMIMLFVGNANATGYDTHVLSGQIVTKIIGAVPATASSGTSAAFAVGSALSGVFNTKQDCDDHIAALINAKFQIPAAQVKDTQLMYSKIQYTVLGVCTPKGYAY